MRHCFVVVVTTAVLGYLALVSVCWGNLDCRRYVWHTGLSVGLIYGFFYVTKKYGFNILNHTGYFLVPACNFISIIFISCIWFISKKFSDGP